MVENLDMDAVARRLNILNKIIDRKHVEPAELKEIMQVPQVKKAITLQAKQKRQEAMDLLSQYKQALKARVSVQQADGKNQDPRLKPAAAPEAPAAADAKPAAPARAADPRQAAAAAVAQQGQSQKQEGVSAVKAPDPRRAAAMDPRQADPRQADPRQASAAKPVDPRQVQPAAPAVPQQTRPSGQQADPRKAADVPSPAAPAGLSSVPAADSESVSAAGLLRQPSGPVEVEAPARPAIQAEADEDDEEEANNEAVAQQRLLLRGSSALGFSETWLRQFMERLPFKAQLQMQNGSAASAPSDFRPPASQAPAIGRKVLSASGEQMVYVDGMAPSEVLLLLQLVFMLEDRVKESSSSTDLVRSMPYTFAQLQVEPAVDVMLKSLFDELPYQCTTTGLRFASREKLRKHTDAVFRRRAAQQSRQRGVAERNWTESIPSRGWMESIPEWVGNRDLLVGPALFRVDSGEGGDTNNKTGGGGEASTRLAQDLGQGGDSGMAGQETVSDSWLCPGDLRRSLCPVSGEMLDIQWSSDLNDWAFTDVVAAELDMETPLKFAAGKDGQACSASSKHLSETSVIYKRSCFPHTSMASRLQALRDCTTSGKRLLGPDQQEIPAPPPQKKKKPRPLEASDSDLARYVSQVKAQRANKRQAAAVAW